MEYGPISSRERIEVLDIVRGFALLGIFLVNIPAFNRPDLIYTIYGGEHELSTLDQGIRLFFDLFVQGKFYTIFSFLFGLGFFIFMSRAENKGLNINLLFSRRLLVLLVFGLIHLVFLWFGDILHTYAITGFFLVFFYKRELRTILTWAFVLLGITFSLYLLLFLIPADQFANQLASSDQIGTVKAAEAIEVYLYSGFSEWLSYRFREEVIPVLSNEIFLLPDILGMFLLGLYAGRIGIFQNPSSHIAFIKRVWTFCGTLSLPFLSLLALLRLKFINIYPYQEVAEEFLIYFSGALLSLFYIATILLLTQQERWKRRLLPLSYLGRMALTNYFLQTIVSIAVFIGFNLYGNVSLAFGLLFALLVYPLQIFFSYQWLKLYQFGPMEGLWRSLTYGRIQSFKKESV